MSSGDDIVVMIPLKTVIFKQLTQIDNFGTYNRTG